LDSIYSNLELPDKGPSYDKMETFSLLYLRTLCLVTAALASFVVAVFISALWPNFIYILIKAIRGKNPEGRPPSPRHPAVWAGCLLSVIVATCSSTIAALLPQPTIAIGTSPFSAEATFAPTQVNGQSSATPITVTVVATALPSENIGRIVFDSFVAQKWQVFAIDPDGSNFTQLTNMPEGIGDPAISPDGTLIVFVGDNGKKLYVMNADGTSIKPVYEIDAEAGWPSWSFDSRRIVFASQVNGHKNLFLMNYDGTGVERLTNTSADDLGPALSPDGRQIAFFSNRSGVWEIYKLTISSGNIAQLTNAGDIVHQGWPSWSPDGLSIAFEYSGVAGESDVFVMKEDGTQVQNITNNPAYDGAPVWSPDGKRIAFASSRDGSLDLYLMRRDGSQVQRLTTIWAWGPSWSNR
jgi:TolB protein